MQFLLDTHTFLWFVSDSNEIPEELFDLLESDVDLLLSIASLWEIAISDFNGYAIKKIWCIPQEEQSD